ncbi:hypothetical protein EES46_01610 [Streptomyces sp. ADI98-10]|nr:hypothetical protein EES46_01610 [Streptomyces sp. ADI98-10]
MAKIAESEGITPRGLVLEPLTSLKQICNHPARYSGASTLPRRIFGAPAYPARLPDHNPVSSRPGWDITLDV